ncbi:MAG: carboxypeptidase-like regulatory domain-containing protein, partial [Bacteroidota bacterium]
MRYLVLSLCSLLSVMSLSAQTGILSGRIVDEATLPLAGATIIVDGVRGTTSDADGYYGIVNLPAGQHKLTISFIGFEKVDTDITIKAGETTVKNFSLEPGINLSEVVITSQLRGQARALSNQRSRYNITNVIAADQIGRFPDANIGDALKRVPGIS